MLKIENVDVYGWDAAIRGARNPMNSWDKSDSYWTHIEDPETLETAKFQFFMGDNDYRLLKNLANAGPDHGKYLRMIQVYCDIVAPLYLYKELDTYRFGVEKNSCSTMHKIHSRPLVLEDFSYEHLTKSRVGVLRDIIGILNRERNLYVDGWHETEKHAVEPHDKKHWWQMIQLLPSSYNQRRTYMISYAALRNMYHARKNHKLDEWRVFCEWIHTLPYSDLITGEERA